MWARSASILGNDTSCEVRERFLELYDDGEDPKKIASIVLEEQKENLRYDKTNVRLGLAWVCWECKVLTKNIFNKVKKIIDTGEDIAFNKSLEASNTFLKKREQVLNSFIEKISTDRTKARKKRITPDQVDSLYKAWMCFTYKNTSGKYIGIYITLSEHYKNKGRFEFFFMDFESLSIPTIGMFTHSKLYGLKKLGKDWWGYEYGWNVTDLHYEKDTKEDFFTYLPKVFILIGKLRSPDNNKLINDYKGNWMYLREPEKMVNSMEEIRSIHIKKFSLSTITLDELLDKIALEE